MKKPVLPSNEQERLEALENYKILDTLPEKDFDDLTMLASQICNAPIALISLIDQNRQWFKSKVGLSATETPRDIAFCAHAILQDEVFVIPDSFKDERFSDNPLATGDPHVRFYAGAPLKTPSGQHIGTLCVIDDHPRNLSEQQIKSLEALARQVISQLELRQNIVSLHAATNAKSAFLANISHEIRTPMNGIIGMTDLLLESADDVAVVDRLQIIKNCGNSLISIINELLDFSKLEAKKVELEYRPIQLRKLVADVISLLSSKALEKNILLNMNIDKSVPDWISADETRVRQILINLISNAIKFTEIGSVDVSLKADLLSNKKYKLNFSVKDTGIGIPEDVKIKLFKPFSQADISTTRKYGGTGLGLAICKELCSKMNGSISVETHLGKGSTFFFNFEAEISKASSGKEKSEVLLKESKNIGIQFPLKILIAEDNPVNQMVAQSYLKKLGYASDLAENGLIVLEKIEKNHYDIVLMDCQMPEMDGYEATQAIRKKLKYSNLKIVALTASSMKEEIDKCKLAGMNDFLSKPIDIASLIKVLTETFLEINKKTA